MSSRSPSVVIIGGGIAGLACALRIRENSPQLRLQLLEKSPKAGGLLQSERHGPFLVEAGPDSMVTDKREALDLSLRLGLEDELLQTNNKSRKVYVVHRGKLEALPFGFSFIAPTKMTPLLRSPILSTKGKLRATLDLVLPRNEQKEDESLANFVSRRFGPEVLHRLAAPLASGVYGTPAHQLSMRASLARFLDLETRYRSVSLGARREQRAGGQGNNGVRYNLFMSLRGGMGELPAKAALELGGVLRTDTEVLGVEDLRKEEASNRPRYRIRLQKGASLLADAIVLAVPAPQASRLCANISNALATKLAKIPYGSSAAVTLAWKHRKGIKHNLDAFGFVSPPCEGLPLLASTWSSTKYAGRAPDEGALLRTYVGGENGRHWLEREDQELVELVQAHLRRLIGADSTPSLAFVHRYQSALPQYTLGHLERVQAIEASLKEVPGVSPRWQCLPWHRYLGRDSEWPKGCRSSARVPESASKSDRLASWEQRFNTRSMTARCALCGKPFQESKTKPFCSKECKLIDLNNWLDGKYTIPDHGQAPSEEELSTHSPLN